MVGVEFLLATTRAESKIRARHHLRMNQAKPPGPSRLQMLRALPRINRGLVEYLRELTDQYGETVLLPLRYPTYVLTNPDDIKYILVTNPQNYHKAGGLKVGKELLGSGLVSGEPPLHTRQRKLMQPMFHRSSIANFATLMTDATNEQLKLWNDGVTIDLALEMMELTLTIVGRALFSTDLCGEAAQLGNAFTIAQRLITRRQRNVPIPLWMPTPANRRYRAAIDQINSSIGAIIASRQAQPEAGRPHDLLTMLLAARFEDGSPMPPQQLRDEVVTLMMAGNETLANNLNWTWYLLSQNPAAEARLVEEWQNVLGGRTPTLADMPALVYTEMVLAESLRLFPPAWTLARRVLSDDKLPSGVTLPAGSEAILVQYVCHRNAKYFRDPDRFDPERFHPDKKSSNPACSYFPFGAGPRYCIGEAFARLEGVLLLTTIGQRYHLELAPDQKIGLEPLITLRPRHGLRMILRDRAKSAIGHSQATIEA
jgi:cytochrome P450